MKTLLFIGRFQPFHLGHYAVARHALNHCDQLIIGLGSAGGPLSPRNPFYLTERMDMISLSFPKEKTRVRFAALPDFPQSDKDWARNVEREMFRKVGSSDWGLVGFEKDQSSFYLRLFPQRELLLYPDCPLQVSATQIREQLFQKFDPADIILLVPWATYEVLCSIDLKTRWDLINRKDKP